MLQKLGEASTKKAALGQSVSSPMYLQTYLSLPDFNLLFRCFFLLQQACGFEYTSKLQRMFQDIGVSKDLNDKFKSHLINTEALDCK